MKLTPRTDEAILPTEVVHQDSHSEGWVSVEFARELELELGEALEKVKQLERERDHANDTASAVLKENAALVDRVKQLEAALNMAVVQ